jgi:3-mercaptopyruvate sulfurtransferase SseA
MLTSAAVRRSLQPTSRMAATSSATFSSSSLKSPIFQTSIVQPNEVLNKMKDSNIKFKFLDASWHLNPSRNAIKEFAEMRIPGAVHFDIDAISTKSDLPHMLPNQTFFAESCSNLGLERDDNIIVYTAKDAFSAARAWWMFHCFGHENVYVMNGGLVGWVEAGGDVVEGNDGGGGGGGGGGAAQQQCDTVSPAASEYVGAELNEDLVVDWIRVDEVSRAIKDGYAKEPLILDARSSGRFFGKSWK